MPHNYNSKLKEIWAFIFPVVEAQSPNHWTTKEFPHHFLGGMDRNTVFPFLSLPKGHLLLREGMEKMQCWRKNWIIAVEASAGNYPKNEKVGNSRIEKEGWNGECFKENDSRSESNWHWGKGKNRWVFTKENVYKGLLCVVQWDPELRSI